MIDADKVIAVAERAIYIGAGKEQLFTADEIQALTSMLREAENDAARYRFMRDSGKFLESGAEFYAAIDQAMKEKCDE